MLDIVRQTLVVAIGNRAWCSKTIGLDFDVTAKEQRDLAVTLMRDIAGDATDRLG